ncbi:GerAB/ArcD/ProY family transporter [Paenibacillus sp. GSMTC-2017]|uniref:GerAB/ArcD/ProY family transporter n=1 Tax=Paenibacillus sp. GSMTC-2017 TaxID=2794350 RepID=UPI0018D5F8F9|nr:GerAB/ArcD/ProY family transporter [Paenibacillus sp. GSMTC-2017]MBH5318414.1 GerAB/ArcD/ProY family transporter [Paenibacillus sp. GSMTC-2017]
MKTEYKVPDHMTIPPSSAFYIAFGAQAGLDYLTFQRRLANIVGQDAWIAIIIAALCMHIGIWFMYCLLNREKTDLITINKRMFGNVIGGILNITLIFNFLIVAAMSVRLYAEIVKIWVFPDLQIGILISLLLLLVYYIVAGGFRVIVGFLLFAQISLAFIAVYAVLMPYYYPSNLLPIWSHKFTELMEATWSMLPGYLGIEALLIFYPFIKDGKKAQAWSHFGNIVTMIIYLMAFIFSMMFYSLGQLQEENWPILTLFKFVEFPFMERVEFIGASFQLFRLVPLLALYVWIAIQSTKLQFRFAKRKTLPLCLVIVFVCSLAFKDSEQTMFFYRTASYFGFALIFLYVPLLTLLSRLKGRLHS